MTLFFFPSVEAELPVQKVPFLMPESPVERPAMEWQDQRRIIPVSKLGSPKFRGHRWFWIVFFSGEPFDRNVQPMQQVDFDPLTLLEMQIINELFDVFIRLIFIGFVYTNDDPETLRVLVKWKVINEHIVSRNFPSGGKQVAVNFHQLHSQNHA